MAGLYRAFEHYGGEHYSTPVGGLRTLALADGSQVTLNTNTSLRVLLSETQRRVVLEHGEAFFCVAKDPSRPFAVDVAGQSVIAVGTQFSVRRDVDDVQVVVTEGKVNLRQISDHSREAPTPLGEGAVALAHNAKVIVNRHSASDMQALLSWRSGFLSFHDTPLSEAVAEFNRYNTRKIVIADASIANIRVGGNFRPNNADTFLWLLEKGFPVEVQWNSQQIVLSRH